ncbi:DNA internalization-related competence protein ComEC/Rec2 [Uliginosibacterium flavum]|uniref:DNA internalization-related competence protein ComEC/Rec2 n=1 Tax=Uliginosibacterium flavum TaxID=1396831 RepID=A0ABV2TJH4_9RHOO
MRSFILFFSLGIWLCQQQAELFSWAHALTAAAGGLLVAGMLKKHARRSSWGMLLAAALLAGFAYANWRAELQLADKLAEALEGQDVEVVGRIVDLPQPFARGLRFQLETLDAPPGVPQNLALVWYVQGRYSQTYDATAEEDSSLPAVHAGERWHFTLRLRQPHGSLNPHGFDYEALMFERGIGATGYVRPKGRNERLAAFDATPMAWIDHWRERIRTRFERALPDSPWRGVLVALVVGDQAAIPKDQWKLFRQTGVTHLMSISGLHVTLIAALLGFGVGGLWRRVPALALRLPAQKAAVLAGVLAAGAYVLLAGSGVPAQRTLYMLAVAALALWLGRGTGALRVMTLALLVVLLIDPWAVLSAGFWLSFGAVGALLLMARGLPERGGRWHWLANWLRAQWAVTLFTLPMLLGLFGQFSLVSPLANAVAIPLVSLVITPLALLFALLPLPALAEFAHWLLSLLMTVLQWCAAAPFAVWQQAAPPMWLVAVCSGVALWSLLPRGVPARWIGLLAFVPLLIWSPLRPLPGAAQVTVLDVGQGLAVHVRTATHDLLFDTGPQYSPETDAGERVVIPYLRAEGTPHLDMLIVSHKDKDHAGGADSILAEIPVLAWRSSLPVDSPLLAAAAPHQPCLRGQGWEWDGVHFDMLHPTPEFAGSDNERSCVLRVQTMQGNILLTGDVEITAENALLASLPAQLPAQVLVAPHHGSHSSSQEAFIAAVGARSVVFTAGYRNRYQHPAPEVVARYAASSATLYRSDGDGAVRFDFGQAGLQVSRARIEQARYWHDRTY